MPFKRPKTPYYICRVKNLPGYGYSGELTSKSTSKKVAARMEDALRDVAEMALIEPRYTAILDAVCRDKTVSLPELLNAKNSRSLDDLLRRLRDPLLTDVIRRYREIDKNRHIVHGLQSLEALMPQGARLSWLANARAITELCHRAERGEDTGLPKKRNSVRRYMLRAINKLLRHELGEAERVRIMMGVDYPAEDDTREVHLSPADIRRLITEAVALGYHELSVIIRVALLTSADRGVLLSGPAHHGRISRGLLKRDVRIFREPDGSISGEVYLDDSKVKGRSRTVPLTPALSEDLYLLCSPKRDDDPVFSIAYRDLDYLWKRTRAAAGLDNLRFKDLRAQISQYGEEAGVPLTILQAAMGHADESMTRRYQRRQSALTPDHAAAIERVMGLAV